MRRMIVGRIAGAATLVAALNSPIAWGEDSAGPEPKQPSGTVMVATKSIGAIGVGVTWGDGTLTFGDKDYQFSLKGLSFIDLGIASATVKGNVYDLNNVADFAGDYEAADPGFPLGGEKPSWNPKDEGLTLRNNKGVVVHVWTVQDVPRLRVLRGGVQVTLKPQSARPVTGY